ncbi:virulence RhuM family protein [bacterium]|nr:virulence RhuM family protein [bacterium]MBU1065198.1 virulence RhuM family protein [bacterium]MBU1634636.1 virulence RhuM family protein [bacterium]MBU1874927.1 virulence RhuM family protein [bacterium]
MTDAAGKGSIIIYQPENNIPALEVRLDEETVWLSLNQISTLFGRDKSVISRHIRNIYTSGELSRDSVVANFATTASDGKTYQVDYFNLDLIISVGYRVNSKMGTQFRIWATNILKQHIIQGYTINEKRLQEARDNFRKLKESVDVFQRVVENRTLTDAEAKGIVQVIRDYAHALDTLDGYDRQSLTIENVNRDEHFTLDYDNARSALQELIKAESQKPGRGDLYGKERGNILQGIIASVYQTIGGKDAYPSIEEKAAHLLYFLIKNHPFVDGNKRVAGAMFLWFLEQNRWLYHSDGSKRIADNALTALCLMVAQSDPKEKDLIVKVIINLINKDN